jgi:hypothetical protein
VHPVRFLHTLPLSHVFGQFMGLWVPGLLAAELHFETRLEAPRLMTALESRFGVEIDDLAWQAARTVGGLR